jgi:hypothetical protein
MGQQNQKVRDDITEWKFDFRQSERHFIRFNIIFLYQSGLYSGLPIKTLHAFLLYPIRATCPAHSSSLIWLTY